MTSFRAEISWRSWPKKKPKELEVSVKISWKFAKAVSTVTRVLIAVQGQKVLLEVIFTLNPKNAYTTPIMGNGPNKRRLKNEHWIVRIGKSDR